jgi:hypothetical protein
MTEPLTSSEPAGLAGRVRAAAADLAALEPAVRAAAPWPLSPVFDNSDEATWGPPEVLAHVDEMLPYWLGELARIVEAPVGNEPPAFGRTATDDVRLALLERDRTVPLSELFQRAASESERAAWRIERFAPTDLDRVGRHVARGDLSIREFFERFLVGHLEEHVRQLRAILEGSGHLPTA